MSNRLKIEQQTNLLNTEWSTLRIQSIPLSASNGAMASKKVRLVILLHEYIVRKVFREGPIHQPYCIALIRTWLSGATANLGRYFGVVLFFLPG